MEVTKIHLGPILYDSELPEVPYSRNQYICNLVRNFFLKHNIFERLQHPVPCCHNNRGKVGFNGCSFCFNREFLTASGEANRNQVFCFPKKEYFKYPYISGDFFLQQSQFFFFKCRVALSFLFVCLPLTHFMKIEKCRLMIGGCYFQNANQKEQKLCIQERSHHCDFSLGTIIGLGCIDDTFGPLPFASCDGRWQLATLNIPDQGAICLIFLMRRRSWVLPVLETSAVCLFVTEEMLYSITVVSDRC